ncbi:MAG: hypothetical protein QGI21_05340 [Candidatus Poseidoniaceae archaeon]|jgi:hypothetical protein|nr:hypothetical protein [Candidatus Poseidoniaceae archaeon]
MSLIYSFGSRGPPCYESNIVIYKYIIMNNVGSQKSARLARLKTEIIEYVSMNPGCSAADIVDYLSNTRRMRNHGLTARKVGFFIPRYLKNIVMFTLDRSTGKRVYTVA